MKCLAVIVCILSAVFLYGQSEGTNELDEISKGKYNTYKSDSNAKALGLKFSILYPKSYQIMPEDMSGAIIGFAKSISDGAAIRIAVDTLPKGWEQLLAKKMKITVAEAKAYVLSEAFFKQQLSDGEKFIISKNGFNLVNEDAAFFDYSWKGKANVGDDVSEFMSFYRVYTFYHNDYDIKLIFSRTDIAKNEKALQTEFENNKTLFSFIANTFVISSN